MKRTLLILTICVLTFVSAGVYGSPKQEGTTPPPAKTPPAAKSSQGDGLLVGKVSETMDAGGYTYINLDQSGKKKWVAIPRSEIKVGQQVTLQPGIEMGSFTSKTLNRTFDNIIFSGGLVSHSGESASKPATAKQAVSADAAAKPAEKIKVEKAVGPDAYTVSEVHEKMAALNEKTCVVKGKVVKVSQGIMGKNWIHLQDGTGDPGLGTNKLVTTSQDLPTVGDIVTLKGKIYKDKDFGSGYKYEVIMEEAKIQK